MLEKVGRVPEGPVLEQQIRISESYYVNNIWIIKIFLKFFVSLGSSKLKKFSTNRGFYVFSVK